jgi:uncharacterized protein (DUF58 family)
VAPRPEPRRGRAAPSVGPPAAAPTELPAELLKRLEIKVLRPLDGFLFGDVTGLFYGPSLDLAEVREYQPGDEVRRIDWHVTARTGALHVRQYREERELLAWLVVDASPSMAFGTRRLLKRDLAVEFAAVAASVIGRRGTVGAIGFARGTRRVTPVGAGRRQVLAIVRDLLDLGVASSPAPAPGRDAPGAGTTAGDGLAAALEHVHRTLRRRALVLVVSDFIDAASPDADGDPSWARPLAALGTRHDVVAVRVSDPAERSLGRLGELRFRDLESGEELWVDTEDRRVRVAHARLLERRERAFGRAVTAARADLLELSTDGDLVAPILRFALRRKARRP